VYTVHFHNLDFSIYIPFNLITVDVTPCTWSPFCAILQKQMDWSKASMKICSFVSLPSWVNTGQLAGQEVWSWDAQRQALLYLTSAVQGSQFSTLPADSQHLLHIYFIMEWNCTCGKPLEGPTKLELAHAYENNIVKKVILEMIFFATVPQEK